MQRATLWMRNAAPPGEIRRFISSASYDSCIESWDQKLEEVVQENLIFFFFNRIRRSDPNLWCVAVQDE